MATAISSDMTTPALNLSKKLQPPTEQSRFALDGWHVWCGAPIHGHDGKYYLLYSRWPKGAGFAPGWALRSEIACAVSDSPCGPFKHLNVALPARGINLATGKKFWDGDVTHNPNILRHPNGKYYLYYTGNHGDGEDYPLHRNNQRIGLAVADHPAGPWQRMDTPIVDVSADPGAFDSLVVTNPAAAVRPDGGILLLYKAVEAQPGKAMGGRVRYGAAVADQPDCPYTKIPGRIFESEDPADAKHWMLAEDPFVWFSKGHGRYFAIARDVIGRFTGDAGAIAMFESADGLEWTRSAHPLVLPSRYMLADGRLSSTKLERPALLIENDEPTALFGAADGYEIEGRASSNLAFPIASTHSAASSVPDFTRMIQPLREHSVFSDPDYNIWCGSVVEGDDGKFHMFYSRWPLETGHKGWVTHSEIARAVSDSPYGPFHHVDVVLPERDRTYWDGACTHNPNVLKVGDKYYLYYMGNTGDREPSEGLNWQHRNNQRIGVAVADKPEGPWQRFDKPLIDISTDPNAPDALATNNPSVTVRPDGGVLMIYKAVAKRGPLPFGGPVVHLAATADSPLGPFTKQPKQIFTGNGNFFAAEDPFIWHDGKRYLAIVKDMAGNFTGVNPSLALFVSEDGLTDWKPAPQVLVSGLQVKRPDGTMWNLKKLERPQLLFKNGRPVVLYCAAGDNWDLSGTFNLAIPIADPEQQKEEEK